MKEIRGLACFRDLGGIICAEGKHVVEGKLFRSGHLGKLHSSAAEKLQRMCNISHIVDLRSDSEVKDFPDYPGAWEYHRFVPLNDSRNPSVTRKNRMSILKRLMAKEGGTRKHLCDTYRSLVTLPDCLKAYRELLILLSQNNGGVLWHCTQGKDRTGMGSAIVLLALGAERKAIMQDYLKYNSCCRIKNALIFAGITISRLNCFMARSLNNLMTAQMDYLSAAFDEIDSLYGSTEGFLKKGLMISDEVIMKLRRAYLS